MILSGNVESVMYTTYNKRGNTKKDEKKMRTNPHSEEKKNELL